MLRWLQTEKLAITADKLPTRYLGIDIQRTEDGFLLPQAKLISLTSNVHWHALLSRANCVQQGIHAHAHGSKSRGPQASGNAGYTRSAATSCKRKPFGAAISIASHDYCDHGSACHRRRLSRRKAAHPNTQQSGTGYPVLDNVRAPG